MPSHYGQGDPAVLGALFDEVNRREGEGSIYTLDAAGANLAIPRWSTGLPELDAIIGGGMPRGRVIEIYGAEGSGKTSLLYHLCARHAQALDIPIEGTFDAARAKVFGCKKGQLFVYRAKFGEDAINKTIKFAKAAIPLVGIDSVPSMLPREDFEKIIKNAENDKNDEIRVAGIAGMLSKKLPVIEQVIEVSGTTLIFINQIRDKMQALLFGEKTQTPGGHKLRFSASLRIMVARRAWIEVPNKNPANVAESEKVGMIMKCKVVKSKVCNPLGECELPMFFDRGFVSFDEITTIRKEIMKRNAAMYKKAKQEDEK